MTFFLATFAPEDLVSRDGFGHPAPRASLLILSTQAESDADSRDSSHFPRRRPFIYTVNRHRVSPEFVSSHAIAYRWRPLPGVHRRRASSSQGSSSKGCCLFSIILGQQVLGKPAASLGHRCSLWSPRYGSVWGRALSHTRCSKVTSRGELCNFPILEMDKEGIFWERPFPKLERVSAGFFCKKTKPIILRPTRSISLLAEGTHHPCSRSPLSRLFRPRTRRTRTLGGCWPRDPLVCSPA